MADINKYGFFSFQKMISENLNGFSNSRSLGPVSQGIYSWFKKYLKININKQNGTILIQNILLNNRDLFSQLINKCIEKYKPVRDAEILKKIKEEDKPIENWEINKIRYYNPNTHTKKEYVSSLYDPCYIENEISSIEEEFLNFIDDKVEWWWKNGSEHKQDNFGIQYPDGNEIKTFQPDVLVLHKNGKIGIYDTKGAGDREDKNKLKSEALYKYIIEENKKGKNLCGGLVIKSNNQFRINIKPTYVSFKHNPEDWDYFQV